MNERFARSLGRMRQMIASRRMRMLAVLTVVTISVMAFRAAGLAQGSQHDHQTQVQAPSASSGMMAEMRQADAELKALVTAMNSAKGDAKVEAMAKVINALVTRHESMQVRMAAMRAGGAMMGGQGRGMGGGSRPAAPEPAGK